MQALKGGPFTGRSFKLAARFHDQRVETWQEYVLLLSASLSCLTVMTKVIILSSNITKTIVYKSKSTSVSRQLVFFYGVSRQSCKIPISGLVS